MSQNLNSWISRRNAEALASGSGVFIRVDGGIPGIPAGASTAVRPRSAHVPAGIKPAGILGIVAGVGLAATAAGWLWNQSQERKSWVDRVEQDQTGTRYR